MNRRSGEAELYGVFPECGVCVVMASALDTKDIPDNAVGLAKVSDGSQTTGTISNSMSAWRIQNWPI